MMTIAPIYTGIVEGFPIRFFRSRTSTGGVVVFHEANDLVAFLRHSVSENSHATPDTIETAWHHQRHWISFGGGYICLAPNAYANSLLDALAQEGVISERAEFAYYTEAGTAQKLAFGLPLECKHSVAG